MRIHNLYTDASGQSHFRDIEVVGRRNLAKDDAGRRQPLGVFAEVPLLVPRHLDIAKVGFARGIGV